MPTGRVILWITSQTEQLVVRGEELAGGDLKGGNGVTRWGIPGDRGT